MGSQEGAPQNILQRWGALLSLTLSAAAAAAWHLVPAARWPSRGKHLMRLPKMAWESALTLAILLAATYEPLHRALCGLYLLHPAGAAAVRERRSWHFSSMGRPADRNILHPPIQQGQAQPAGTQAQCVCCCRLLCEQQVLLTFAAREQHP